MDQKADISIHHSTKAISEIEGADSASEIDDQLRASLAYAVELDDGSMAEVKDDFRSAKPIGCMLRHFLPERIVYAIDTIEEDANAITTALQDDGRRAMGLRRNMGRRFSFPKRSLRCCAKSSKAQSILIRLSRTGIGRSHSSVPRPTHLHSGLGMKGCAASHATSA